MAHLKKKFERRRTPACKGHEKEEGPQKRTGKGWPHSTRTSKEHHMKLLPALTWDSPRKMIASFFPINEHIFSFNFSQLHFEVDRLNAFLKAAERWQSQPKHSSLASCFILDLVLSLRPSDDLWRGWEYWILPGSCFGRRDFYRPIVPGTLLWISAEKGYYGFSYLKWPGSCLIGRD